MDTERVRVEESKLGDALMEVVQAAVERWEHDDGMTHPMIAAALMTATTSFAGEVLAMVCHASGLKDAALTSGAEIIRNGALAMAKLTKDGIERSEAEDRVASRH